MSWEPQASKPTVAPQLCLVAHRSSKLAPGLDSQCPGFLALLSYQLYLHTLRSLMKTPDLQWSSSPKVFNFYPGVFCRTLIPDPRPLVSLQKPEAGCAFLDPVGMKVLPLRVLGGSWCVTLV